ncbi:MAG: 4Fe-4S binding protein [Desulfopila sp.]
MGQEFYFEERQGLALLAGDDFAVVETADGATRYLVANSRRVQAEIYAPEVNFYIDNTKDPEAVKVDNLRRLYRARATAYDLSQQTGQTVVVGTELILIDPSGQGGLVDELGRHGLTVTALAPDQVVGVRGSLGRFEVRVRQAGGATVLSADQVLWHDGPAAFTRRRGVHDPAVLTEQAVLAAVEAEIGVVTYSTQLGFTPSLCQYHQRRVPVCGHCAAICPTGAIQRVDNARELDIAGVDCTGCGRCVGVCPTGALEYRPLPKAAFLRMAELYRGRSALLFADGPALEGLRVDLAERILPFFCECIDLLDESYLLSLLQVTSCPVILWAETIAPVTRDAVALLNEIFQRKFGRDALLVCTDAANLAGLADDPEPLTPFTELAYDLDERSLAKRDIVVRRLDRLLADDELGRVTTGPGLSYGLARIDRQRCTLCLSCTDACSMGALLARAEDNSLRHIAGLCTGCGSCQETCPEKGCITVERGYLDLAPGSFAERVVATDELFRCVECGVGFAPARAVNRIIAAISPLFADDPARLRSLSCCPDCKARVMLASLDSDKNFL